MSPENKFDARQFAKDVIEGLPNRPADQPLPEFLAINLRQVPNWPDNLVPAVREIYLLTHDPVNAVSVPEDFQLLVGRIRGIDRQHDDKEDPVMIHLQQEYDQFRQDLSYETETQYRLLYDLAQDVQRFEKGWFNEWLAIPEGETTDNPEQIMSVREDLRRVRMAFIRERNFNNRAAQLAKRRHPLIGAPDSNIDPRIEGSILSEHKVYSQNELLDSWLPQRVQSWGDTWERIDRLNARHPNVLAASFKDQVLTPEEAGQLNEILPQMNEARLIAGQMVSFVDIKNPAFRRLVGSLQSIPKYQKSLHIFGVNWKSLQGILLNTDGIASMQGDSAKIRELHEQIRRVALVMIFGERIGEEQV